MGNYSGSRFSGWKSMKIYRFTWSIFFFHVKRGKLPTVEPENLSSYPSRTQKVLSREDK